LKYATGLSVVTLHVPSAPPGTSDAHKLSAGPDTCARGASFCTQGKATARAGVLASLPLLLPLPLPLPRTRVVSVHVPCEVLLRVE
jgi:hypothetical protein